MLFTNNEAPIKKEDGDRSYNMYDMDNNLEKDQKFNSVPECVRKEYTSHDDYFMNYLINNKKIKILLTCL